MTDHPGNPHTPRCVGPPQAGRTSSGRTWCRAESVSVHLFLPPADRPAGRPPDRRAEAAGTWAGFGVAAVAGRAGRSKAWGSAVGRLTRPSGRAGWLDEPATIGTRSGRADRLRERGYALRGHRLVRSREGDGPVGT
jgi:hypothetical protein